MRIPSARALGQLFLVRLEEGTWDRGVERLLRDLQPAGVIVPAEPGRFPGTTSIFVERIRRTLETPQFLAVASEDFQHDPVRALLGHGPALPPPPADAAEKGLEAVQALAELRGAALRLHGFNLDLDLSLDLSPPDSGSEFTSRTFGNDPQAVATCGLAYVRGLRRSGILACAGDFPGLGSVKSLPKEPIPVSPKPMADLWRRDLVPFRALLPQLPLLVISPAGYKAYDFDPPCHAMSSSSVVTGLLRVKLGYAGVAIADLRELHADAHDKHLADAVLKSLAAGCDLLVVRGNKRFDQAVRAVSTGLESGRLSTERIQESLSRIARTKKRLPKSLDREALTRAAREFANRYEKWLRTLGG